MSGLSANTYSWSGEGSRFGRGGDLGTGGAAAPGFGVFEKNLRMPFFLVNCKVSSSEGTEDSSEESSSLMVVELGREVGLRP